MGNRLGSAEFPDDYELKEWAFDGGEGEVWRATTARRDGDTHHEWAVKIVHDERLKAHHLESAADALQRCYLRAKDSAREVKQLRLPGVIGAFDVFVGGEPHLPGEAGESRVLYVVSEWIDGANLPVWRKQDDRTFLDVCGVVEALARIVDSITNRALGIIHRDISPANVMVEARSAEVKLIDFTFAVPVQSGPGTVVVNRGYTAPEARATGMGSAAADRYSFGAVVYYLLVGQPPPEHDAANGGRSALIRANFPETVARHVSDLLAEDPARRPVSLVRWAEQLRGLAAEVDTGSGEPSWGDVDLTVDGTNTVQVVAAGTATVASAPLATGALWSLVADGRENVPRTPAAVRTTCDGAGNIVRFVLSRSDTLSVGRAGKWTTAGAAALTGGVAVVRTPDGSAVAFTVDPVAERLTTVEVRVDGRVVRSTGGPYVQHVLAAAAGPDGRPAVVAMTADGAPTVIGAGDPVRLARQEVSVAGVCVTSWGELQCLCAKAGTREIAVFEQLYGRWTEMAPINPPGSVTDLACVGRRGGISMAIAGDNGLWIATEQDGVIANWQRLTAEPGHRVALEVGAAWRLRLVAVVDGQVVVATEDASGSWSRGLKVL
ncbi:serine/threonine protein kinase [Amycolatopsis rifamycinica]|uniref:serine/threonine protein kinase n=1 Tax=Amycolatopsis rifamycinica TaxID=287986 RepID=UPI000AD3213E|nr:protein kinase [Amycolatopsis rifamycinica]